MKNLAQIIEKFSNQKVLVIGDFMIDKYIWGNTRRISPEAPVQIIEGIEETYNPGGAANAAVNINSLGGEVYVVGVVGEDKEGRILLSDLKSKGIEIQGLEKDRSKPTIVKMRMMSQGQQLLRVDYENKDYIGTSLEKKLYKWIKRFIRDIDVVVIVDYAKGTLIPSLIKKIIGLSKAHKKPIVCNFKPNHQEYYKNVNLMSSNLEEAMEMAGIKPKKDNELQRIGRKLLKQFNSNVLITRGEKGLSLFELDGNIVHIPTVAREVRDVCGAGDSVLATVSLCLATGGSLKQAAFLANLAGGIAVGKVGTATVFKEELLKRIRGDGQKIRTPNDLLGAVKRLKADKKKIVFTNGCFDLLGFNHIKHLQYSKGLGDVLIIGLNSDSSIRKIKGDRRPIISQEERAEALAALKCVDYVIIFKEQTPCRLIKTIKPDIHTKGRDYKINELPEAKIVKFYGGKIVLTPLFKGASTTSLIKKIVKNYQAKNK